MQLAAEAVAAGDVTAITPYLKVLDRLDRYQTVAVGHQVYDDEARKKLMDKINRMAANFGVDEVMAAAAHAHLIKIGAIPPDEPGEADGAQDPTPGRGATGGAKRGGQLDVRLRLGAQPERRVERAPDFFIWIRRNPLKSPNSAKGIQGNARIFPWFFLLFLAPNSLSG